MVRDLYVYTLFTPVDASSQQAEFALTVVNLVQLLLNPFQNVLS